MTFSQCPRKTRGDDRYLALDRQGQMFVPYSLSYWLWLEDRRWHVFARVAGCNVRIGGYLPCMLGAYALKHQRCVKNIEFDVLNLGFFMSILAFV